MAEIRAALASGQVPSGPQPPCVGLPSNPTATVSELGRQLVRFARAMVRFKAHQGAGDGETPMAAYGLLFQLAEHPRRAGALAEAVHADPSTVSRQVAQLVARGLVERRPDPVDGRACVLVPTGAGLDVLTALRRRREEQLAVVVSRWAPAEVDQLVSLLTRFITDFESAAPHGVESRTPEES